MIALFLLGFVVRCVTPTTRAPSTLGWASR